MTPVQELVTFPPPDIPEEVRLALAEPLVPYTKQNGTKARQLPGSVPNPSMFKLLSGQHAPVINGNGVAVSGDGYVNGNGNGNGKMRIPMERRYAALSQSSAVAADYEPQILH